MIRVSVCFFLMHSVLFAHEAQIELHSMLYEAGRITLNYSQEIAKAPAPPLAPQSAGCLNAAANWLAIDLQKIAPPEGQTVFTYLLQSPLFDAARDLGFNGIHLKGLKKTGSQGRTGLGIDPRLGTESEYLELGAAAQERGVVLIGDLIGPAAGLGADFFLALRGYHDYPSLFCLIEVDPIDWGLLPSVGPKEFSTNVPWLTLQHLHQKGYIPKRYKPYVKQSDWNATGQIVGVDGKVRRWVYLRNEEGLPLLSWLTSTFASERLAGGDAVDSTLRLGQKILKIESSPPSISLLIRKLGAFTVRQAKGGVESLKDPAADLIYDHLTPVAFRHALIGEETEGLQMIYRTFLQEGIQPKSLVHSLHPLNSADCDWSDLIAHPRKKYRWKEEEISGSLLRERLLNQDKNGSTNWLSLSQENSAQFQSLHELIAFAYALQPGAFAIDSFELTGGSADPLQGKKAAYGSLPAQLRIRRSFALKLQQLLQARRDYSLEQSILVDVLPPKQEAVLLLVFETADAREPQLLALNFSKDPIEERLELPQIANTHPLEIVSRLAEKKIFESTQFSLHLNGYSGKIILFQRQYRP